MPFSEFVIELRLELELEKDLRMLWKLQLGVEIALGVVRVLFFMWCLRCEHQAIDKNMLAFRSVIGA